MKDFFAKSSDKNAILFCYFCRAPIFPFALENLCKMMVITLFMFAATLVVVQGNYYGNDGGNSGNIVATTPSLDDIVVSTLCEGIPKTSWDCCDDGNQCTAGQGDCDKDSHCSGNLVCGSNNCLDDYSLPGSNWGSSADCCIGT